MMLIGFRYWVLRLLKNFRKKDSLRIVGRVGNYLWWEDMGKEQMFVDIIKENKYCGRINLYRKI